jgi:thiol-disulfide isomerase/thioredoxin
MARVLTIFGFLWVLPHLAAGADRVPEVEKLVAEYTAVEKEYFETPAPEPATDADWIRRYDRFPAWNYLPRFVELAEAQPDDEAAFRCCQWIIDRTRNVGNDDKRIFYADQKAWEILTAHHTGRDDLPTLCLRATEYPAPAQERFLRGLVKRQELGHEKLGFATMALAELLAKKHNRIEYYTHRPEAQSDFVKYVLSHWAPEWEENLTPANAPQIKAEAAELFRDVLARYADVPVTISEPGFRRLKNLGEKAGKSLHALEHLTIGSEAQNIVGTDLRGEFLDLRDHKGKVVVISFWFTGCGPCMQLIPDEQRLVATYKDRPFVLLGVCADAALDRAQNTAKEHGIDWPCWFDGENGPIARDWNVLSWPTIYVLDQRGRIAAKYQGSGDLEAKIKELMEAKQ